MEGSRILSDAEVVAGCRNGDEAAWNELVDRFQLYIYAILTQAFRLSQHEAEDVFLALAGASANLSVGETSPKLKCPVGRPGELAAGKLAAAKAGGDRYPATAG